MTKNKLLSSFTLFSVLFFLQINFVKAQMVSGSGYIQGSYVEIGIDGAGGFEGANTSTCPPPAGYHGGPPIRSGGANLYGFVADPQMNLWAGSAFDGDFFTPGSPENGWGFQIGAATGASTDHSNNSTGLDQIPGAITSWNHTFSCYTSDWEGDYTSATNLHFKISYLLMQTDLYYTTTVSITNNTAATIPDMYYYRNVDPDNNESIGGGFTTQNTIVSEPGVTAGCNLAHVSATQSTPWNSYLGFAATGANWRADYGGFSNRDAADMWTGAGYTQTVGSTAFVDEAISLAYRIQNLAPGATETFSFVVILNAASATAAINNLLYLSYPGSPTGPASACLPTEDTIRTCGGPVPITITGPIVSDFTWSWSPTTGLTPATGPSVSANPAVTTSYTATGTPLSVCESPITINFVVMVTPGGGSNPVITAVPPLCVTTPPFNFTADTLGGTWTTTCSTCLNDSTGLFNPALAGAGTYLITYTTTNTCNSTDTMYVTVSGSDPTVTPHAPVCQGSAPYTMTAASTGGTWSGTGVNASTGVFTPSTAGSFVITYSLPGVCAASDSTTVVVNPTTPPVTTFTYISPVCISGINPVPTPIAGFTTGGTYSSTPAGLTISSSTGNVTLSTSAAGTYYITYSYPATTCGPAGSSTDTLIITPLIVPVLGFTYPTVCAHDSSQGPTLAAGFTTGGLFTAPAGVSIIDTSGVIDFTATAPGTYTISYSVIGSTPLCTANGTNTASITINPLPTVIMSSDAEIYLGQSTYVYASGGTGYGWTPNLNLSCANCDSSVSAPTETTKYCVGVTNLGCVDTGCVTVKVDIPCPSNRNLIVPNAFTPNGDGVNDALCLSGWDDCITKFQIDIFDRWGENVYESKDPAFCWDGVYKGKLLDPAVFVYFIKATYDLAGATPINAPTTFDVNKKGNISLVR